MWGMTARRMRSGLFESTNACHANVTPLLRVSHLGLAGGFITLHPQHSIARFYLCWAFIRRPRLAQLPPRRKCKWRDTHISPRHSQPAAASVVITVKQLAFAGTPPSLAAARVEGDVAAQHVKHTCAMDSGCMCRYMGMHPTNNGFSSL